MADGLPTGFIPKKSLATKRPTKSSHLSLYFLISALFFILALFLSAGVFIYGSLLKRNISSKASSLERAKEAFEPSLIKELARSDSRIEAAKKLLDSHTALSSLFTLLEESTLKNVSFDNFDFNRDSSGKATITMSGTAKDYAAVVLQSETFGKSKFLRDIIFSNLNLDKLGNVTFDLSATLDDSLISFGNSLN